MNHPTDDVTLEQHLAQQRPVRALLHLYDRQRKSLVIGAVAFAIKHAPVWAMPIFVADIIDSVARPTQASIPDLVRDAVWLGLLLLQNLPMNVFSALHISRANRNLELKLRFAVSKRLHEVSMLYYGDRSVGILQSKLLRDIDGVTEATRILFDNGLACTFTMVFAIIVTWWKQPALLLYFLLLIPVAVALIITTHEKLRKLNAKLRVNMERLASEVSNMAHLMPLTRAHGLEGKAMAGFRRSSECAAEAGRKVDRSNAFFGSLSYATFQGFYISCLLAGAFAAVSQRSRITAGDLVLVSSYFGLITSSVLGLASMIRPIVKGIESLRSMGELFAYPDLERSEGKVVIPRLQGEIAFETVEFVYPRASSFALRDISFRVTAGETVAVIGPSGAGKSTLIRLLVGFLQPQQGRILIDGQDMRQCDLHSLRQSISVILQESALFDGTVRENLAYSCDLAKEEAMIAGLVEANAWDFVRRLPQGLDTRIGEKGAHLSGGQRQRLAIAAAFIRNPKILILDEATSALDIESEELVQEALQRLMRGRTTLLIAHRLSTIRIADRVLSLEAGRIIEFGTPEELGAAGGHFHRFQTKQCGYALTSLTTAN